MLNCSQTAHNLNLTQQAVLPAAFARFDILRTLLLKIQVLWDSTRILGLLFTAYEGIAVLRNVGQKCEETALRLQVADVYLKCHVMLVSLFSIHIH